MKATDLSCGVPLESVQSSGDRDIGAIQTRMISLQAHSHQKVSSEAEEQSQTDRRWMTTKRHWSVTQSEGVTIHTIDHIASMLALCIRSGPLCRSDALVAKCWDLSGAYKQFPLSDEGFHID